MRIVRFSAVVIVAVVMTNGTTRAQETGAEPAQATPPATQSGFFNRLFKAYARDWDPKTENGPEPARRGFPGPLNAPPYPWADWPYGGSPTIGAPDTSGGPLMQALYDGPHGKAWEASKIKIYGWVNYGINVSTSNRDQGKYGNAPAAYYVIPNSGQLDQATLYVQRVPDTVQTDHFDWGFRFTNMYGLDYRFTTAKGYFSGQLLDRNKQYGYDPVMFYIDLYFPHVAQGMNVRIGRYISLPDIEAQLAPDNYTYSHSLLYTYDCYTQTGINTTTKINDHWMVQLGLSPGCEAAPWVSDAKLTLNACVGYTWNKGGDNFYNCANSINDGKYAYNNMQAYYTTWYHKINDSWHTATEAWYQYEKDVPSVFGPIPAETGANGAWCDAGQDRCFAPDWAVVNYVEKQLSRKDYITIRNEYFDDLRGQRTGVKSRYTEHLLMWGHWIGSSVLIRPELRFERAYDNPAYSNGTRKNQLVFASDIIFKY